LGPAIPHARFLYSPEVPLTRKNAAAPSSSEAIGHKKKPPSSEEHKKEPSKKVRQRTSKARPRKVSGVKSKKVAARGPKAPLQSELLKRIVASLEDDKAEEIVTINLEGRSSLCDAAVIASGRSSRHVMAIAEHLARRLKEEGYGTRPVSGAAQGDWVLVDAGDVIVHVFRPEVREYYDLEGMWNVASPGRV
jgi:ribosome-associated protein